MFEITIVYISRGSFHPDIKATQALLENLTIINID